jgi:hypothetical protein
MSDDVKLTFSERLEILAQRLGIPIRQMYRVVPGVYGDTCERVLAQGAEFRPTANTLKNLAEAEEWAKAKDYTLEPWEMELCHDNEERYKNWVVRDFRRRIARQNERVEAAEAQLAEATRRIAALEARIAELSSPVAQVKPVVERRPWGWFLPRERAKS